MAGSRRSTRLLPGPAGALPARAQAGRELEALLIVPVPVPGAAAVLSRLRTAGHGIWLVSDMHLSSSDLRAVRDAHGLAVEAAELVSSEVAAS